MIRVVHPIPDPRVKKAPDPYVIGPPENRLGSFIQRYRPGFFPLLIKVLNGLK
jgi:hypothetical protein